MSTIECHLCGRRIDERETKWSRPFASAQRDADAVLQTNRVITDQPVDGSVPVCGECLADAGATPHPGHTLVIERDGGRADVRKMKAAGTWEYVRDDVTDIHTAYGIARNNLNPGCRVWFRHESQPESAIRLYR